MSATCLQMLRFLPLTEYNEVNRIVFLLLKALTLKHEKTILSRNNVLVILENPKSSNSFYNLFQTIFQNKTVKKVVCGLSSLAGTVCAIS